MSWFQLDASTIASRVLAEGDGDRIPSLFGSIVRGLVGFAIIAVAGFLPWAACGEWLVARFGEGGMFGAGAAVFVLLSGVLLHRLIVGPDSLLIFYKLFSLVVAVLALAWVIGSICLGTDLGSVVGLLGGTLAVAWMLGRAFEVSGAWWKVAPLLFGLAALGYFGGAWLELWVRTQGGLVLAPDARKIVARLLWAAAFGAGFGAGMGFAFYICQSGVREYLRAEASRHAKPGGD